MRTIVRTWLRSAVWLCLIVTLLGCNMPATVVATPTSQIPPTYTPLPTYTPFPTFTPLLLDTPILTQEPPVNPSLPTVQMPTFEVLPTLPPVSGGFWVRIRNWVDDDVNLFREGKAGEWHFLGWLAHGYYGEYPFPSLGEWLIRFCRRTKDGDSYACRSKVVFFEHELDEVSVP